MPNASAVDNDDAPDPRPTVWNGAGVAARGGENVSEGPSPGRPAGEVPAAISACPAAVVAAGRTWGAWGAITGFLEASAGVVLGAVTAAAFAGAAADTWIIFGAGSQEEARRRSPCPFSARAATSTDWWSRSMDSRLRTAVTSPAQARSTYTRQSGPGARRGGEMREMQIDHHTFEVLGHHSGPLAARQEHSIPRKQNKNAFWTAQPQTRKTLARAVGGSGPALKTCEVHIMRDCTS